MSGMCYYQVLADIELAQELESESEKKKASQVTVFLI